MLWLNKKIGDIVTSINPKDIAFLLASSLEINKAKRSRLKAQVALDCLSAHSHFKKYLFEFYFKERSDILRCVALGGIEGLLKKLYIGRSVHKGGSVYNAFSSKRVQFSTENLDDGRRIQLLNKLGIKASLYIPVANFGVLVIDKTDTYKFDEYEMTVLKNFVNEVVAPSLDLALDNEKNFGASIRDPLTGLYNHGYFIFQLEREVENAKRGDNKVSLVMIDVDYFKYYNDHNGHPMGDKVLANIGKILRNSTRKGDIVARYGGEEFAVILFNAKPNDAIEKAEEFRKAIANFKFDKEELQPNGDLTISLGVANFPLHAKDHSELVEKADEALYHSKNSGKNRVSVYGKY
ncbi:GGDEF domain-containing protein [Candidatus Woesearchaeota archaeon]|nr:GGDEF domain-containing protein [Candidatus Woesearchaeota archaeon]